MAKFPVNKDRFDPYRNFKFKIKWDGQYVAGLNKCSALKKTTEVTDWYEAGDRSTPHKLPGKTTYEAITLEAGVTHDTAFEEWANKVNNYEGDSKMSLKEFRKDPVIIDVFNLQGTKVLSYTVHQCWVSGGPDRGHAPPGGLPVSRAAVAGRGLCGALPPASGAEPGRRPAPAP
ncbi:MAG: phage tail protein [bacterium]|nr:phage tail protein [bacterium]